MSIGLAFLLGLAVGSVLRIPLRFLLGGMAFLIGVYWVLSPHEVEGWISSWRGYVEREVSHLLVWGTRFFTFAVHSPQEALAQVSGFLLSVAPTYAFWAGVLGRVLS
ncbi:hypothetical protein [Thermus albus]|uniref:hypothetical protein n=1 Tax=Thermus albus TaxID=2908146 RepID=UPI001FA988D4|nr:hypothetical protein [Thermus albus]